MSGAMVRACRADLKTETRRILNPQPEGAFSMLPAWHCPYGVPGDRLWVRENGWERPARSARDLREGADTWLPYYFDADEEDPAWFREHGFRRRPSIHMPRWACRLVLEVVGVRVEQLQQITEAGARAEGCRPATLGPGQIHWADGVVGDFRALWESLNAKRASWYTNPWVWVISFRRLEAAALQRAA